LRLVEDASGADLLADLAEDGVDRMDVGVDEADVAERLRAAGLVERVRDPLAVLGAVAGVEEGRARRVDAVVERGGGGDRLEDRARRVEALRRAVGQRGRR